MHPYALGRNLVSGHKLPGEFPTKSCVRFQRDGRSLLTTSKFGTAPVRSNIIQIYYQLCHTRRASVRCLPRHRYQSVQEPRIEVTEIRQMSRADVPLLYQVIASLRPHGHRSWRINDADQLDAILSGARISPENGAWSLAFSADVPCGYSLIEPEINIGRIIVGCAVTPDSRDLYPVLLSDAKARAQDISDDSDVKLHIAVQQGEPEFVTENILASGFAREREFLNMRGDADEMIGRIQDADRTEMRIQRVRLDSKDEIAAVTSLHNRCFEGSWGFSPNSVEEIDERINNDFELSGVHPILAAATHEVDIPIAYVWTTIHESDGRIEMIGVDPEQRTRGLGRSMFNAGVEHLVDNGATTISLDVDADNEPAVNLYSTAGMAAYSRTVYYSL